MGSDLAMNPPYDPIPAQHAAALRRIYRLARYDVSASIETLDKIVAIAGEALGLATTPMGQRTRFAEPSDEL